MKQPSKAFLVFALVLSTCTSLLASTVQAETPATDSTKNRGEPWTDAQIQQYREHNLNLCRKWTDPKFHGECDAATACSLERITREIPFRIYAITRDERKEQALEPKERAKYETYMKQLGEINRDCSHGF